MCLRRNEVATAHNATMYNANKLPEYATVPSEDHQYTMRSLFERYRDGGGICWVDAEPPEMSVMSDTGEITCMARLRMPMSMPHENTYIGPVPRFHDTLASALHVVTDWIADAIDSGNLWCPGGSVRLRRRSSNMWSPAKLGEDGSWSYYGDVCSDVISSTMDLVQAADLSPLSIGTVHAAMESEQISRVQTFGGFYPYPRTTVPSTSLFGTSHNNSFVDMSPYEPKKKPDMDMRAFRDEHVGFICAAHTSHSFEAGKSRRVAMDVSVRLMCYDMYAAVDGMCTREAFCDESQKTWTFFCAGQICKIGEDTLRQLCVYHKLMSIGRDPQFGLYIREELRLCVVSVSSGVLTKLCTNGVWSDNSNAHKSDRLRLGVSPYIATHGRDFHRSCLSGHYNYIPFVEQNAAVRTSISSAQILQAVCLPWCPATAAVSPVYTFKPLVTTKVYARIMAKQESGFDIASYLPGENVCVLYHNLPLNYEDAILVSRRYVEYGGFSTVSICRYLLPPSDYVPPVGSRLCSKLSKWWKSACQYGCKHEKKYLESCRVLSPFGPPTGVVVSNTVMKSGEQSVKVRSYETFQPGNKVSTSHGQKGVAAALVDPEDMPICVTKDGVQIIPDVVMAVSSIVTRQTLGQVYESGASIQRLMHPHLSKVIAADEVAPLGENVTVIDGITGKTFRTAMYSEEGAPRLNTTSATIGYVRMFNQSQMTRERHFTSHRSMTSRTLRTPIRRSRGGALKEGEMEVQATVASGLVRCVEELRRRGDEVTVLVCTRCQRLRLLHVCTEDTGFIEVALPYDTVVLDCVTKIVYNSAFVYTVEPDV